MSSSDLIRWGGLAAMVAGVAYVSEAIVFAVSPGGALQSVVSLVAVLLTAGWGFSGSTPCRKGTTGA